MAAEGAAASAALKREPEELPDGRLPKRKKTVTWADDELELPLGLTPDDDPTAAAAFAAAAAAGSLSPPGGSGADSRRQAPPAVVVLPCDGLYDALSADLLQEQVDTPPAAGEVPLSRRQLLERRLARTDQLAELYESELWALLEELRLRHSQFVGGTAGAGGGGSDRRSVWKEQQQGGDAGGEHAAAEADVAAGSELTGDEPAEAELAGDGAGSKRQQDAGGGHEADATAQAAGSKEEGKDAAAQPGSALRALWQQQQQQQAQQQQADSKQRTAGQQSNSEQQQGDGEQPQQPEQQQQEELEQQQAAQQPPRFEDVEALILTGQAAALPPVDEKALVAHRESFVRRLALLGRLEQGALAATCRELDALGGLAVLCGRRCRFVLRRSAVALGRCTESQGKVDVDLSLEAPEAAHRISRQQAQLSLEPDGGFRLRCTGRRSMLVNGQLLARGQSAPLPSLSHIRAGDVSLLFVANAAAVARAVQRSSQLVV